MQHEFYTFRYRNWWDGRWICRWDSGSRYFLIWFSKVNIIIIINGVPFLLWIFCRGDLYSQKFKLRTHILWSLSYQNWTAKINFLPNMQNFSAETIQSKKTAQKLSRVGICKQVIGADEKIKLLFLTSKRVNETFLY